ncbi:MAG: hypothetical protein KatS3mg100_436 [Candidatus Parcubacteria bacterium]|nr:MAG: hypothetical protein KatS3mg100_436 [Candidatus Parcubacteria bacterium]
MPHAKPTTEITINASGRSLGRVASETALALQGKISPKYARHHLEAALRVKVVGLRNVRVDERRLASRVYYTHSGHLGGLRARTLGERTARQGIAEVFRSVVRGMLPRNRLRKIMLANLSCEE